jgi:Domain of Unknown Function (DUF1259)
MTRMTTLSTIFAVAALLPAATTAQSIDWKVFAEPFVSIAHAQSIDWKKVDVALGKTATVSGEVHRYGLPRSDLRVTLDGVQIKPALALGGWVAFTPMHGQAMVMGDLVLLETEITPVMTKLLDSGLEITAIHNHILRASPATFYMHVAGHGDPEKMATAIRSALSSDSKTPFDPPATTAAAAPAVDLDTAKLDEIMAAKGISSAFLDGIQRRKAAWRSARRLAGPTPSTSSRPAAARRPSPATSW